MHQRMQIESNSGPSWPVRMSEAVSAVEMVGQVGNVLAGDEVTAGVDSFSSVGGNLLGAVWKFGDAAHWLTTRNPLTGTFQSMPVGSLSGAIKRASELAQSGFDVYLSPSEFEAHAKTRKAQDVACVRGFWLDIDVGAAKAEQGQGYATLQEAMAAVKAFRIAAGLPGLTHVVCSGGGLHVYWVVDEPITPTQWLASAKMFKAVTKSLELLADPTRTADIASLMRVPDTVNFKDKANPRAVKLIYSSAALINKELMLSAIEAAHIAHCGVAKPQRPALLKMHVPFEGQGQTQRWLNVPGELSKLASALCALDPDCAEEIWSLRRIAPLARAAVAMPECYVDLYNLAHAWSSGALRGVASKPWTTAGGNGLTGEQYFGHVWNRFLTEKYSGRPTTLRTIYRDAAMTGWVDPADQFEMITDASEVAA